MANTKKYVDIGMNMEEMEEEESMDGELSTLFLTSRNVGKMALAAWLTRKTKSVKRLAGPVEPKPSLRKAVLATNSGGDEAAQSLRFAIGRIGGSRNVVQRVCEEALVAATVSGNVGSIRALVELTTIRPTAKHIAIAALNRSAPLVEALINEFGVQPTQDSLCIACRVSHDSIVWFLLEAGAVPSREHMQIIIDNYQRYSASSRASGTDCEWLQATMRIARLLVMYGYVPDASICLAAYRGPQATTLSEFLKKTRRLGEACVTACTKKPDDRVWSPFGDGMDEPLSEVKALLLSGAHPGAWHLSVALDAGNEDLLYVLIQAGAVLLDIHSHQAASMDNLAPEVHAMIEACYHVPGTPFVTKPRWWAG